MIALLGGTFDPVHNGHLYIAGEVVTAFSADKVLFITSREPPHRDMPGATAEQRADMVQLAIADQPNYVFSNVELERPGPSYTVDTVKILKKLYPDDEMALIVGSDAYDQFTTWLHWEEIIDYVKLIVVNRNRDDSKEETQIPQEAIYTLQVAPCPISASDIRQRVHDKQSIAELVPQAVAEYIEQHQLYQ